MTISRLLYLQRLDTHLRDENGDCSSSDSDADDSSADESSEEEFVEDAYDLSEFLGTTILRERMSDSRRGQTRREEESRAAAVDNMSAPIAGSRSGRTQHVAEADGERTTSNSQNQSSSNSSPPSPWQHSTAKKRVIGDLKDSSSDIHLFLGPYGPKNWKQVKFDKIWGVYGQRYPKSNFRENLKRLLLHFQNGTGDFSPEKKEQWYTSPGNVSKAYSLLFSLYMDTTYSTVVEEMTAEQIWNSHEKFQLYTLDDFTIYNKRMFDLTNKKKKLAKEEEASFRRDMLKITNNEKTRRGYPFWNKHRASVLLEEDERNGTAQNMKPKDLWNMRREYKDFPLSVFRKHVYQERMKQLAAPFWQHKRNKAAEKKNKEEVQQMGDEWYQNQFNGMMSKMMIEEWGATNNSSV